MVLAIYGRLVQGEEGLQYALKGGRQFSDKNVLSSQISDKSHNRQIFNRKVTMQISDAIEKEVEYTQLCIVQCCPHKKLLGKKRDNGK